MKFFSPTTFALLQLRLQLLSSETTSLVNTYGLFVGLYVSFLWPGTASEYERIRRVILNGGDEEAFAFRQSVTDGCNMTAVAGAIVTQVALSALFLPGLSTAHWVARAMLLFAVVSGCLSVYSACVLQRIVGKLYKAALVREWLSIPIASSSLEEPKASLPAVFIISAPFTMVRSCIFAFLTALTVYQGFTWTRQLDKAAGQNDSRNVFITLLVGLGFCLLFFGFVFSMKSVENLLTVEYKKGIIQEHPNRSETAEAKKLSRCEPTDSGTSQIFTHLPPMQFCPSRDRTSVQGLAITLEAAARAHSLCAEADQQVAQQYTIALQEVGEGATQDALVVVV